MVIKLRLCTIWLVILCLLICGCSNTDNGIEDYVNVSLDKPIGGIPCVVMTPIFLTQAIVGIDGDSLSIGCDLFDLDITFGENVLDTLFLSKDGDGFRIDLLDERTEYSIFTKSVDMANYVFSLGAVIDNPVILEEEFIFNTVLEQILDYTTLCRVKDGRIQVMLNGHLEWDHDILSDDILFLEDRIKDVKKEQDLLFEKEGDFDIVKRIRSNFRDKDIKDSVPILEEFGGKAKLEIRPSGYVLFADGVSGKSFGTNLVRVVGYNVQNGTVTFAINYVNYTFSVDSEILSTIISKVKV